MKRLVVKVPKGLSMSKGKFASQAVHAALYAAGVHDDVGAVVVLRGSKSEVASMPFTVYDEGLTEVEPGSLTAGAQWEPDVDRDTTTGRPVNE